MFRVLASYSLVALLLIRSHGLISVPQYPYIFDSTHPDKPLGGVRQNGSITEPNFLDMLEILLGMDGVQDGVQDVPFIVQHRTSGHTVTRTHHRLQIGDYDIHCPCEGISLGGGTQLTGR